MCQKRRSASVKLVDGKILRVDECLAFCIHALNQYGIETVASCCGHGKYSKTIVIKHNGAFRELLSGIVIPREEGFYKKDGEGLFFLLECLNKKERGVKKAKKK